MDTSKPNQRSAYSTAFKASTLPADITISMDAFDYAAITPRGIETEGKVIKRRLSAAQRADCAPVRGAFQEPTHPSLTDAASGERVDSTNISSATQKDQSRRRHADRLAPDRSPTMIDGLPP